MYENYFGLKKKLFSSNAKGQAVFVGPQQAKGIKSLNNGLAAVDSIVVVTGPVGVGKTKIVSRALESITPGRMVALVGRMALQSDEVLELLLTGFGISRQATGTVQKFAAFRRLLTERAAAGAQLAIVVEDAQRVGQDALVEMEALTAADSGDAAGANIILMGQPELKEWLANPALARLRQRTRLRQTVEPFNAPEVMGYLRHCIRAAGGDVDNIIDARAVDMLYRCSEGIPRVINNLCESALTMAAQDGAGPLTAEFIQQIARDALGIEVVLPPTAAARSTPKPAPAPEPPAQMAPPQPPESAQENLDSTQPQRTRPEWAVERSGNWDDDDEEVPGELTFEVEQTSRMEAINADKIKQAEMAGRDPSTFKMAPMMTVDKNTDVDAQSEPVPAANPQGGDGDLPTLSQSMRINAPTPATAEELATADAEEQAKTEAKVKAQAKAKAEEKAKAEAKAKAAAKAKTEEKAKAEAKAKVDAKAKAEEKAKAEAKAKAAAKAKAEEKAKVEAKVKAAEKAKAEAKAKEEAKAKAAAKAKAEAKASAEAKTKAKTKAAAESNPAENPRMPDIDVLEAAIAAAHDEAAGDEPPPAGGDGDDEGNLPAGGVPTLTLDKALDEKRTTAADVAEVAEELGKAESLRDLTESLAETLFGNAEFEAIAAEVAANPPADKAAALDKAAVPNKATAPEKAAAPKNPVALDEPAAPAKTAAKDPSLLLELVEDTAVAEAVDPLDPDGSPRKQGNTGEFEMTVSKRLEMVKVLNEAGPALEKIEMANEKAAEEAPKSDEPQPASLEDQMKSEMTATLKSLSSADGPPSPADDDEPKEKKTGLFSRFGRSS